MMQITFHAVDDQQIVISDELGFFDGDVRRRGRSDEATPQYRPAMKPVPAIA